MKVEACRTNQKEICTFSLKKTLRYQRGNQKPYIEEGPTT